jgi:hypothetical protein
MSRLHPGLGNAEETVTLKQTLACFLSCFLVLGTTPFSAHLAFAADTAASAESGEVYAPLSDDELDALVAPVALYPDPLLAQVLGAATYPDQVVEANEFLEANSKLSGDALRKATEKKQWDPAVQSLTQFPSVVQQLAKNITWTSALGDAAANQQGAIMAAVQRMRAKAQAAGNLTSGKEIKVIQESPQIIVIQPAQPQVIYVPTYNPGVVYGVPVVVPGYATADIAAATAIAFGAGILIASAVSSGSCRVGMSWGMSWSSASIHCGGAPYYGNPYWRGGYYPRYYPGYRPPYYYPPPRPYPPPGYRPPGAYPPRPTQPIARATATPAKPGGPAAGGSSPTGGRPGSGAPPGGASGAPPGAGAPGGSHPGAGTQPSGPNTRPTPGARPAGPGNPPATVQPGTRPSGSVGGPGPSTPAQQQASRSTRGYPGPTSQPARNPNAFSGSGGGRQQSARGNHSMSSGAPRAGGAPQAGAAPR